ncbi:MAG: copper amine oxidase N-terminal domain-containing protein [Peptococcaceae bacterium]|nr:MAG: copper amine oxidase N-terminal domain-containing protein [Peptococcaceae bacterium]
MDRFRLQNLMGLKNGYWRLLIAGLLLFFGLLSIPVYSASGGLLGGVVGDTVGTVDGALGGVVGDTVGTVDGALGGVAGDTVGTVDGALGGVAGDTVGTVDDALGGVVGDTVGAVDDALGGVAGDAVGTVDDALGGGTLEDLNKVVDGLLGENGTNDGSAGGNVTGNVYVNPPPVPPPAKKKVVVIFQVGNKNYYINGAFGLMDVAPYIKHDRCYLPARFVAYSLGIKPADVTWSKDTKTATFTRNGTIVGATIGKDVIYVNNKPINIDVLTELVEPGRTMLPYRFIAESFGATVKWDDANKAVIVEYYE